MQRIRKKCLYKGRKCSVDREEGGSLVLVTSDGIWADQDGGWERVDKFEWEKTVAASDVSMLPDENQGDNT